MVSVAHRSWILGIVALTGVACTADSPAGGSGGSERPPVFAEIATLEAETIRDVIELVGQLEATEEVVLRPEIEGVVDEILFEEGNRVEKDEVLIRLDDARQRAMVEEARARRRLAEDVHRRQSRLAEQSVAAESELVRAALELEVAKAELRRAEVELARTVIRAPFDGSAGIRHVSPGARVEPETDLVAVHATDRLKVLFTLPEVALGLATTGIPFEVSVSAFPGESFPGTVYFVGPAVNTTTRRLPVKGTLSNPGRRLRPGTFANVRIETERHEKTIVVPDAAVVYDAQGTFAWKLGDDDRAKRVAIELGIRQGGRVEVATGLVAGDRIVVAGTNKVFPGAVVRPPPDGSVPSEVS